MSHTLLIETQFEDISQFVEGMAGRVQEDRLILFGAEPLAEDSEVRFRVLLSDGTNGLVGSAQVSASYDGWEEQPGSRPAEMRFDIVLVNVHYDAMSEVVYDRILQVEAGARGTGEVELPQEEEIFDADPSEVSFDDEAPSEHFVEASTRIEAVSAFRRSGPENLDLTDFMDVGDLPLQQQRTPPSQPPVAPRSEPPPGILRPVAGAVLTRPSRTASWFPSAVAAPTPRGSHGGFFAHLGAGLPIPRVPPRPDLDPSLRVSPAPRPVRSPSEAPIPSGSVTLSGIGDPTADWGETRPVETPEFQEDNEWGGG